MDYKKKKFVKVYTSGPITNSTAAAAQVAQELWVAVTNFGKQAVKVKVEVFNWGDPAVSAGLTTTPVGMAVPMNAMSVAVMPAEKVKVPAWRTQQFFADLLTGGPMCTPVLTYEVRVTVFSNEPDAEVVFNAVAFSAGAAEAEEPHVEEEEPVEEEPEAPEAPEAAPVTAALIPFKHFVLLKSE